jgi:hypothetical protein
MRLIEHITEPKKVLVAWQAPDAKFKHGTGTRFIVGEITNSDGRVILRYYDNDDTKTAAELGLWD